MTRIAIIGGGIGGLTAANALSRAGIEVAVYEAAAELKEIGAGVALHPNAMKVLRAIGVEDDVRKVAGRSDWQFMRSWKTGRVIAKTSRQQQAASFGTEGATVHRADLLDVLADALPANAVTLGKRCTVVRPDGDIAVARFADGSEIEADIIVGADGIHSTVRASLFGPDAPRFTGKIEDGAVMATALSAEASDPLTGLARYERTRRPRASRVVLTARERGLSNHLTSPWAAWRRDLLIAWRRHVNRRDPEGRGGAWLADYDASSPNVLAD